ncbi:hypothetical protein [Leisingera sp. MMG026]|uniref:hypothetical protein n=1 Tax=Leisingera sp. MMG026 TaxID=2909982 RepID=UPI001F190B1B|nr:hypothetical protein [Leisingera sp. MMG026]MCF6433535.1 hypothetical protein [Leisingera sp. MMG026]
MAGKTSHRGKDDLVTGSKEADCRENYQNCTRFRVLTVFSLALMVICGLWSFADHRLVDGAPVWAKPMKFAFSFAIFFATIEVFESFMSARLRRGKPLQIAFGVMSVCFLAEMVYIFYQAARAEPSHFNLSSLFHTVMYSGLMFASAICILIVNLYIAWLIKHDHEAHISPVLREAVWLGGLLTFLLTMIVAIYLSAQDGHFVGAHPEGAPTLPVLGWSRVAGDLRPAHFLSLHAMQLLPLIAFALNRRGSLGRRSLFCWSALYAVFTMAVFCQALMGYPLIPVA